jgi:hypothetical protein
MRFAWRLLGAASLALAGSAFAAAKAPAENPAVDTTLHHEAPAEVSTTIVGDKDSDLGLNLLPWKREHADSIDPPPGLYDVAPETLDARALARSVEDRQSVEAYRRQQMR